MGKKSNSLFAFALGAGLGATQGCFLPLMQEIIREINYPTG